LLCASLCPEMSADDVAVPDAEIAPPAIDGAPAAEVKDAAAAAAPAIAGSDAPPNQTVYINNLPEKIKKDDIKRALYSLLSQYGNILDILVQKTYKMRGQAFVIFDDLAGATRAVREMQSFTFYGKPMKLSYAKEKSDIISKMDGSFKARPKRKHEVAKPEGGKKQAKTQDRIKETKAKAAAAAKASTVASMDTDKPAAPKQSKQPEQPNKILFIQNLPANATQEALTMLFSQQPGFGEMRLVAGVAGIAFAEFVDDFASASAMQVLQGFRITADNAIKISFAKKG